MTMVRQLTAASVLVTTFGMAVPALAQTSAPQATARPAEAVTTPLVGMATPEDYLIGPDDVLTVVFWRDKDMSGDVTVRPDGKITLPLINDVDAAGLTPEQLRLNITAAATKFIEGPTVAVAVKAINSRRVFITGNIAKPGPYPLMAPTTVMQLIATAGGVLEYADTANISVMRTVNGRPTSVRFNYKDVSKRKNLQQNILLNPGDTIVVP